MVLFTQVVCHTCCKVLTFPLGAYSTRCRNCNTVNAAAQMEFPCGGCQTSLLTPINSLSVLCPCCATITDIPMELLPPVDHLVTQNEEESKQKTLYVEPPTALPHQQKPLLLATKVL